DPDVLVDEVGVVVDVDFPVVIEVAVAPSGQASGDALVDLHIVVDVDLAIEVRVAAVGVHDQRVGACHRLTGPDGRGGGGDALGLGRLGDADVGVVAADGVRLGSRDAGGSGPPAAVASGGNEPGDAVVHTSVPTADVAGRD